MLTTAAQNRGLRVGRPVEQIDSECIGGQVCIQLPALVSLVHLLLIVLGLIARQVGKEAGKGDRNECSGPLGPLELAEKIYQQLH